MGIEQNFDDNLEKAVKTQTHAMPAGSKFLLHQLVKNIDEVADMLDSDNVVSEYNVGNLKEVIDEFQTEEELDEYQLPGSWTNYSGYGKVKPAFSFKSQGPNPGSMVGSGYNFESGGPLGVSYFTERKKYNVGDLKKVIQGLKEEIVDPDPDTEPCAGQECYMNCTGVGTGDCYCDNGTCKSNSSVNVGVGDNKDVKGGLQNRGRGERALDSLRHTKEWSVGGMISEKDESYCKKRQKGKCCDGGDGRECGKWIEDPANKKCTCSYKGSCCSGNKGIGISEKEMDEATSTSSSGAYSTPKFWAKEWKKYNTKKKKKKSSKRKSSRNNKRWMPGAQFVKVKEKCKKFPYCNQGDIKALEIWEKEIMRESAKNVSKKTGLSEKEVREKIEREIQELITRGFYKSPVTDLVGGGKMNTPIGKIFTMSGNKPKYES